MEKEFTGHVIKRGKFLFKEVKGVYDIDDFMQSWSGKFEVVSGELPQLEDDGELVMDQGPRGHIIITRIRIGTEVVEFKGKGHLND
ncbi:MAG: hypothetical protein R3F19_02250 [Verrucomicrobiales bacterium]|nr:hypothetical protein [Verrucomicrobiae bacterium]